ncbi:MAG: N-acetylmuramoyl-L-alanine amidase [Oscillospiraceae bacterium]|nr:N-acetylmuramoyl-L-alanine amidase [Oscillospiraceae bacterium]
MKVFLDPGHNFAPPDTGATGFGLREQDVTFQVADTVRALLELSGVDVRMSRNNLTDILGRTVTESLTLRAQGSDDFGADYCVSIHCNAGGGIGAETYAFVSGSFGDQLAQKIQAQLVNMGMRNRGVKYSQDLFMLRRPKAPAVLVELGFIDNANDNDILRNRQFDLAEAVTKGICEQLNIDYKGGEDDVTDVVDTTDTNDVTDTTEHWAKQYLDSLTAAGIVENPEKWEDFDNPVTKGLLLALVDKMMDNLKG